MMIVQATANLLAAYVAPKASSFEREAATTPASMDKVTISAAAAALAANSANDVHAKPYSISDSKYAWLSKVAHEDPNLAESFAKAMISQPDGIMYDGDSIDHPPLRFAISKEIITPEKEAEFNKQSASVLADRKQIYQEERAKGKSYAEILDKLIHNKDLLPDSYKKIITWGTDQIAWNNSQAAIEPNSVQS